MKPLQPLGDRIVVKALSPPGKIGFIHIPEHTRTQATITHYKGLVLASGPKAVEHCPVGSIVHLHEAWGEKVIYQEKELYIGRLRDVNFVCEGEALEATNSFLS